MLNQHTRLLILIFASLLSSIVWAATSHPRLIATNEDKAIILSKIESQPWAKTVFEQMKQRLYPYVSHLRMTTEYDPAWLTSRYLLNRENGKHFTNMKVVPSGLELDSIWGNAPVPTIRYSIGDVRPETREIYPLRVPSIEELIPYNKNTKIPFYNLVTHKYVHVDPSRFSEVINGEINRLALDAAIMYWLTDDKEYGRMAADVLQQWVKAAYYQNPIEGCRQSGLFSSRVEGDTEYASLILVYDFLGNFLKENKYDVSMYQSVFEKIAWTLISKGTLENFSSKSPMLTMAVLSLDNPVKRQKLINYIIDTDSIVAREYGNLSLQSAMSKVISQQGFYKDPGKHASAVYNLLLTSWMLEKNDVPITNALPQLTQIGKVRFQSAFPDFSLPSFGDISNVYPDGELLELALAFSSLKKQENTEEIRSLLGLMEQKGFHKRNNTSSLGLIINTSQPLHTDLPQNYWTRSGTVDYAQLFFQRNGFDQSNGLMAIVQGATYSGNHANGMSAEFYGAGRVMGVDPGIGRNQEDSLHIHYYSQWAAHNTVIAAGSSSPERIYKGGGTSKAMGRIELSSMEPLADEEAVSDNNSFMSTKYYEPFTRTDQDRTISIVRTSSASGFYVDIYRSNNKLWNDYLYHNVGNRLELMDEDRKRIPMKTDQLPLVEPDFPGLRFISQTKSTELYKKSVIARFIIGTNEKMSAYMQLLMPGADKRTYFSGLSPKAESALAPYDSLPMPTLIVHHEGEAVNIPFVSVIEPFVGRENFTVNSVEWLNKNYKTPLTAIKIKCKDDQTFWVLNSVEGNRRGVIPSGHFCGTYATVEFKKDTLASIYMGRGMELSFKQFSLKGEDANCSANIIFGNNYFDISSTQVVQINWKTIKAKKAYIVQNGSEEKVPLTKPRKSESYSIEPTNGARVFFE